MKRVLMGFGITSITVSLVVGSLVAPAVAVSRQDGPEVRISDVVFAGPGCVPGGASVDMSAGGTGLDLRYRDFFVEVGQVVADGASTWRDADSKECVVSLRLDYPSGWSFAVTSLASRGHARLAAGTTAKPATGYTFAGIPSPADGTSSLEGPTDANYAYSDEVRSPVWSECGSSQALAARMRLSADARNAARDSSSRVTLGAKPGDVATEIGLDWKKC
ncbi:hypothetical protein GCM10010124_00540 [Pilimelia terevasa]|uniref:DUF4360 domain-containing protein n=1 Tax=Pilimelia terevasa TaxID=53372 RepID=A0A8J3FGX5_9ACTN|nr:DUF4360 domain-containing protein [Pilimelia terevasa]GGK11784.1 hypothetical protein GCM10010124_00540 [Pilimelia terevasa]